MTDAELQRKGVRLVAPDWDPWRPEQVADLLQGVGVPWYVAGGWALDPDCSQASRPHEDLEIGVPAAGFPAIRAALHEFDFEVVGAGRRWNLDSPAFARTHQTWVRDPASGAYRLDVFRDPHDHGTWIYRRDQRVRIQSDELILRTRDGIPYLIPEIVLLFKAKGARAKDDLDLEKALPRLGPARRARLRHLITLVYPGHRWLGGI